MVSVLTSCVVDCGFEPGLVKQKTIKLLLAASPLCMQLERARATTGCHRIMIVCQSEATFLSADCFFNEIALERSN